MNEGNNNKKVVKTVLIVLVSVFAGFILLIGIGILLLVGGAKWFISSIPEYMEQRNEAASQKTFSTYYDDSAVVSARFFERDWAGSGYVYTDVPEEVLEDLVKDLDSLHIVKVGGMHDYYYGYVSGVELIYENGRRISFDGERISYYPDMGDEEKASIFMYFEEGREGFFDILTKYSGPSDPLIRPVYEHPVSEYSAGELSGVSFETVSVSQTGTDLKILNGSDKRIGVSEWYVVEKKENDTWYSLTRHDSGSADVQTDDLQDAEPGSEIFMSLDWSDDYGRLFDGEYRVLMMIYEYSEEGQISEPVIMSAEFVINRTKRR